jgi:hypothetical protein
VCTSTSQLRGCHSTAIRPYLQPFLDQKCKGPLGRLRTSELRRNAQVPSGLKTQGFKTQDYRVPWIARNALRLQQLGLAGVRRNCWNEKLP